MNCASCHGVFSKDNRVPHVLPACGHSLCRPCLALLTTHRGFVCPICRKKQPNVDLSALHPNHALLEVITAQKEENGRNGKKTGKEDNNHNIETKNGARSKESVCVEHGEARLAYWCGTCEVAGCGECMMEEHGGGWRGGGGDVTKTHKPKRFDAALREKRDNLQSIVDEVMDSVDRAQARRRHPSPYVTGTRRLLMDIGAIIGKLRLASSFLACQIQEREDDNAIFSRLRQELNELMCQVPPASSSSSTAATLGELRAVMEYYIEIKKFQDGTLADVLKERGSQTEATAKADQQAFLTSSAAAALINTHAAALCRKVAWHGGVEVVGGGGGRVGRVSWDYHHRELHLFPHLHHHSLHLHCFQRPLTPRPPTTHPSRRFALKWAMMQPMMHEVKKVFMVLAWGQDREEWIYLKLRHSSTSATTSSSPHRRFIRFLVGDGDGADSSFLGPLSTTVEEVLAGAGLKGIHLGTHHHHRKEDQKEKGKQNNTESKEGNTQENKTEDAGAKPSLPRLPSPGDVVCMTEEKDDREADSEGDLQFWLVTEGMKNMHNPSPVDCVTGVEVVGSLLPYHHHLLGKLPGLTGVKVEDSGVLLPCDEDEEENGPYIPNHLPKHQYQPGALKSKGVQTEREGMSVLGFVRAESGIGLSTPMIIKPRKCVMLGKKGGDSGEEKDSKESDEGEENWEESKDSTEGEDDREDSKDSNEGEDDREDSKDSNEGEDDREDSKDSTEGEDDREDSKDSTEGEDDTEESKESDDGEDDMEEERDI